MSEAKHLARTICNYMKEQPDHYAPDMKTVQAALALADDDFKLGLDWCIERGIIVMDAKIRHTAELPKAPAFKADGDTLPTEAISEADASLDRLTDAWA